MTASTKDSKLRNADTEMVKKMGSKMKRCIKGHMNSPNATVCWKCKTTSFQMQQKGY